MDVTPQLLHDVEFREAKRGYNMQEVDDFLERIAVGVERQEAQLREAQQRVEALEARLAEAERRAAEAEERASSTAEADETLKRTLVLAQRTADAAIREAKEEAERTLAGAREQASRLLAEAQEASARARAEAEDEARRAHEDARARVLAEMAELEARRDALRSDVESLEGHLERRRSAIARAADELRTLLEDPDALGELPLPELQVGDAPRSAPEPEAAPAPRPPLVAPPLEQVEAAAPAEAEPAASEWTPDDAAWPAEAPAEEAPAAEEAEPATQPVDVLADPAEDDDDAYLRELRKAMTDDAPLGPRDEDFAPQPEGSLFEGSDQPRSRFGRRR